MTANQEDRWRSWFVIWLLEIEAMLSALQAVLEVLSNPVGLSIEMLEAGMGEYLQMSQTPVYIFSNGCRESPELWAQRWKTVPSNMYRKPSAPTM